jgi:hypothetical protein
MALSFCGILDIDQYKLILQSPSSLPPPSMRDPTTDVMVTIYGSAGHVSKVLCVVNQTAVQAPVHASRL